MTRNVSNYNTCSRDAGAHPPVFHLTNFMIIFSLPSFFQLTSSQRFSKDLHVCPFIGSLLICSPLQTSWIPGCDMHNHELPVRDTVSTAVTMMCCSLVWHVGTNVSEEAVTTIFMVFTKIIVVFMKFLFMEYP
jgi:hypothetical protein